MKLYGNRSYASKNLNESIRFSFIGKFSSRFDAIRQGCDWNESGKNGRNRIISMRFAKYRYYWLESRHSKNKS
ncbi:hypothetical protein XI25_13835 [Paenibacillus sp. DMB20]|nr:hypothetical protein XI25_13835 [Paenibacillus sp. DMB20]